MIKKIILLVFIVTGCANKETITKIVEKTYVNCSDKINCSVDFSKTFTFDYMYIISEGITEVGINKIIGFNYPYTKDSTTRLILFVKDNQIVYKEEEAVFHNPYSINFPRNKIKFNRDDAVFNIKKQDNRNIYILSAN